MMYSVHNFEHCIYVYPHKLPKYLGSTQQAFHVVQGQLCFEGSESSLCIFEVKDWRFEVQMALIVMK
jgi:hypothetical protein